MKTLVALVVGVAVAISANVAAAYVVMVATPIPAISTEADTTHAVQSAVQDVLDHAIAFTPTIVTLKGAKVVGDRIHLLLVVSDADGESTIETLWNDYGAEGEPSSRGGCDATAPGPR